MRLATHGPLQSALLTRSLLSLQIPANTYMKEVQSVKDG
jgi:hypothetical protein